MRPKSSRLLVMDASVLHSSGETGDPVSSACRKCLQDVLSICHRAAMTPEIGDEWKRHGSRFARKWRRSMMAKKKIRMDVCPTKSSLNIESFAGKHKQAVEKVLHLLETALAADRIIVTLDDSLRRALKSTPNGANFEKSLRWINPATGGTEILKSL